MEYTGSNLGTGSYSYSVLLTNVTVGNYSSIASECTFHAGDNHLCIDDRRVVYSINWEMETEYKPITIGHDVWIGRGVRVLENVTIGNGAIIGAGAVIAKDVKPYAVVVGNPQRVVRYRFTPKQIKKLQRIAWWLWPKDVVEKRKEDLKDIGTFLKIYS